MNFILQTINGEITLDMCFQMQRAKEFWDWRDKDKSFNIIHSDLDTLLYDTRACNLDFKEWCPIGTLEFVEKYIRYNIGEIAAINAMTPLKIPHSLELFTGRKIYYAELNKTYYSGGTCFIKDILRLKNPLNGKYESLDAAKEAGLVHVQVSSILTDDMLASEWRLFIHNGEAVDVKNYSGDPFLYPDKNTIDKICEVNNGQLQEGTIDLYVTKTGETYIMECHRFFSCGLYGFAQLDILPLMYWRTFKNIIK